MTEETKKTQKVATTEQPNFLTEFKGEGFDDESVNVASTDLKMSQIKLIQKFKEGHWKPGDFVDTITLANYGTSVDVLILKQEKEWLKFNDDFTLKTRSYDGKYWEDSTPLTEDEKWKALSYKFYVLVVDDMQPFPAFMSFKSMSSASGKDLINYIQRLSKATNEPIFLRKYTVSSEPDSNPKGDFHIMKVKPNGYLPTEDHAKLAKKAFALIKDFDFRAVKEDQFAEGPLPADTEALD